jgi:hypothetical protein
MVEYVGPKTHNPQASWEVIWTKESVAKTELIFRRLVERVEGTYLKEMDKWVGRGYGQERE